MQRDSKLARGSTGRLRLELTYLSSLVTRLGKPQRIFVGFFDITFESTDVQLITLDARFRKIFSFKTCSSS
jgi:hypothetical protein